jgi:hypothetical protein
MYLGNIAGLIVVLTTVPLFASILRIPFSIIAPVIIVICAIGAYTVHSAMLDVWFMLGFGVVGYLFKKLDYPLAPLVLALVLGDKAEDSFRQSMLVSQGDVMIMWSNPLVGSITTLALVLLFWPLISQAARLLRAGKPRQDAERAAGTLSAMPVIAMTQEMGSLAKDVALQLAAEMGLAVMRYEVVDRVAGGCTCQEPRRPAARRQGRLVERLTTDQRSVAMYTADELYALAERGNVVLRGWGATVLLRPVPHVVCVRITRRSSSASPG